MMTVIPTNAIRKTLSNSRRMYRDNSRMDVPTRLCVCHARADHITFGSFLQQQSCVLGARAHGTAAAGLHTAEKRGPAIGGVREPAVLGQAGPAESIDPDSRLGYRPGP